MPVKPRECIRNNYALWRVPGETTDRRPHSIGQGPHTLDDHDDGRGVILVIVPLLSLTADQMKKNWVALQIHGLVEAYNMDEIPLSLIIERIIPIMLEIGYSSNSTTFLFIFPQQLASTQVFLNASFKCHQNQTLRLVAINEVHIHAQHIRSFRESLCILTDIFFAVVFCVGQWYPLVLAMTATMTIELLPSYSELTNIDWSLPEHQKWSRWQEFQQRNILINFEVLDHFSRAYPPLLNFLEENEESSAFVFLNFQSKCDAVSKAIEELIIKMWLSFDLLVVHGKLDKHEKFSLISLFNGILSMDCRAQDWQEKQGKMDNGNKIALAEVVQWKL